VRPWILHLRNPIACYDYGMIKLNTVTWYSRLGAIILFIGIVPVLCFYIGIQYELVISTPTQMSAPELSQELQSSTVSTSPSSVSGMSDYINPQYHFSILYPTTYGFTEENPPNQNDGQLVSFYDNQLIIAVPNKSLLTAPCWFNATTSQVTINNVLFVAGDVSQDWRTARDGAGIGYCADYQGQEYWIIASTPSMSNGLSTRVTDSIQKQMISSFKFIK